MTNTISFAGAPSGGAISGTLTVGEAQSLQFPDPQVASVTGGGSTSFFAVSTNATNDARPEDTSSSGSRDAIFQQQRNTCAPTDVRRRAGEPTLAIVRDEPLGIIASHRR